jgi:hypothetical protein
MLAVAGTIGCSKEGSAEDRSGQSALWNPFAKPEPVTLEEGTVLRVRTTTAVSTKSHKAGDPFSATLLEPLVVNGKQIAPRGAEIGGVVAESDPGGRVKGVARLAVRLTSLTLASGERIDIMTNTIARQARTTKKKDATKIAVGSGVGAAVGAIAGGGRGAAIGAAAGGGAGTGVVLATRGEPAVLPSESVLQFRLAAPVTIQNGV